MAGSISPRHWPIARDRANLTIHSRGTAIVPMSVPLTQALDREMKALPIRLFVFLVLPMLASCASVESRGSDQLCAEIARFAGNAKAEVIQSVTLIGGWGGEEPNTLMTHECRHLGYEPGKVLCAYLVPNTSWEFGRYNARDAAACMDSQERKHFSAQLEQGVSPVEITSTIRQLTDKNIQVTLRFYHTGGHELSALDISATRSPAE